MSWTGLDPYDVRVADAGGFAALDATKRSRWQLCPPPPRPFRPVTHGRAALAYRIYLGKS